MASTIVAAASRNEKLMGKNPLSGNPKLRPNQTSNPNPNRQIQNRGGGLYSDESPIRNQQQFAPEDAASYNRKAAAPDSSRNGGFQFGEYKTVDFGSCSRDELKDLKRSFSKELELIRSFIVRIGSSSKKGLTKKRPLTSLTGLSGSDHQQKRQAVENVNNGALMKSCGHVLGKLMKHKQGWIFNKPVDAVSMGLHDYFQIVKSPMDLGTVKMKLGKGQYGSPLEFAADVRLTFKNALLYNPKGHDVYVIAEQLLAFFEGMFRSVSEKFNEEQQMFREKQKFVQIDELPESSWNKNSNHVKKQQVEKVTKVEKVGKMKKVNESVQKVERMPPVAGSSNLVERERDREVVAQQSPVRTPSPKRLSPVKAVVKKKQPKPKAKDLNKRDMSMEEKHKLGVALQSLPEEKMAQVVQIIKKRNGHLTESGDEIELDIEAVDKETLWELDRFMTYWKKMVSKIRRQALMGINNNATTSESKMVPENVDNGASSGKKWGNGEGGGGDEDVEIEDDDEEAPTASFPPVQIDKDEEQGHTKAAASSGSSSSSSSSSGSSSSSDSDSSSGSDSDADNAQSRDLSKT